MNQGIFGFPTALSGSVISVSEFDASGTYTIPEDFSSLEILLVAGGGGGGSGGRSTGTNTISGGGGGGSGGGIVHQIFYKNELQKIRNLVITIGIGGVGGPSRTAAQLINTGGAGGVGQAGGNSSVRSNENNLFLMNAHGGGGGAGGTTPTAAGAAAGGAARTSFISATPFTMVQGGFGSTSTEGGGANGPHVEYVNFRFNVGAGGGSATSTTNSFPGGVIRVASPSLANPAVSNFNYAGIELEGITAAYGGSINLGNDGGKGKDGQSLYQLSAGSQYFSGFGGSGGGGANSVGGGNGGNGYRGGGGGGGGGVRTTAALASNQVPSGAGGNGGNGYCRIIARK